MFPLLEIKNLQIDFVTEGETITAVKNITLTVNRNEIIGIAGESGSGKSVTSLAILQLLSSPPAKYMEGEILFSPDGHQQINLIALSRDRLRAIRGKQIAMIFQEPMTSLNPVFTCGDQVMEAIHLHTRVTREEAKKRTIELFDKVKLPDPAGVFNRYPHQLSGGQKQRVMIAMAMSGNPSLLICDEPTTALDVTVQKTILELIKEIQSATGMGVIFITHDLGVIAQIAHRVAIMYKGSIVEEGKMPGIFQSPAHPYTRALLASRPALYPKGTRLPVVSDFLDEPRKDENMVSHETEPFTGETHKNILISVQNLSVYFPSKKSFTGKPLEFIKAVDNVSFEIYKGETLGLVGESGCGKTTLGRTLLQLIKPTSGRIYYEGMDLSLLAPPALKKFRKKIQIIFQDPYSSLNPSLTIGSAIEEPLKIHEPHLSSNQTKERVIRLLEKVSLKPEYFHRYPHEFSGGQRQRIVIARALSLNPEFIVCDESVSALDVSVQAQVLNLLNDLKQEFGFTIVFISHDLSVIRYISDRIIVMNKGKIEEAGFAEEIYTRPKSTVTQKLLEAVPMIDSSL